MGSKQAIKKLAKFLEYMLGRRPDEFGLVPDPDGFVKLKEFFLAIHEEEGFRHVRQGLINELILSEPNPPVEIQVNQIRAANRDRLPAARHAVDIPRLLYTTVTPKSHPVVLEKGISPTRHPFVVLSSDEAMALRMGGRRIGSPVLITVNVRQAEEKDIYFRQSGEILFLADFLPPGCFTAPPLPKEKPALKKAKKPEKPERLRIPGSYLLDIQDKKEKNKTKGKQKNGSWKRNKKRLRRQKKEKWPS